MENLTELLEQFKAESKQQAIRLTAQRSDRITATSSKFGGLPYLSKNFAYPTDVNGNPLKLLAQLNFGELPPLADFPTSGILQFFVLHDYDIGSDWQNQGNQSHHKVIYHREIHENDQMTDFPEVKFISPYPPGEEEEWFPFQGEFAVTGELAEIFPTFGSVDFDVKFNPFAEKHQIDMKSRETWKTVDTFLSENFNDHHLIGGFPSFVQGDPRHHKKNLGKYDTLLFQMSSDSWKENWEETWGKVPIEEEIAWGDGGIANFFINRTDLQNLKFDDVLYNWDCG